MRIHVVNKWEGIPSIGNNVQRHWSLKCHTQTLYITFTDNSMENKTILPHLWYHNPLLINITQLHVYCKNLLYYIFIPPSLPCIIIIHFTCTYVISPTIHHYYFCLSFKRSFLIGKKIFFWNTFWCST